MENSIGSSNKMVILDATGFATIFNEDQGEWEHGAWFSNKTYKEDRKNIKGQTSEIIEENGYRKEKIIRNGKTIKRIIGKIEPVPPVILLPLTKQQTDQQEAIETGQEFQEELKKHPKIDIGEMY